MRHYHAGSNVPGYISEGDIATFSNRRYAASYAYQDARSALANRREYDEGRKSYLSGRDGYYSIDSDDPYDLGLVFWVNPCNEPDCTTEDD